MNFERDLQALIQSADEVNRQEIELLKEVLGVLGGWAVAKANNTAVLRERIARLAALPQQQPLPYPAPPSYGKGANPRDAINTLRGQGLN